MSEYSIFDPNAAMNDRMTGEERLYNMMKQRQAFTDLMYQKQMHQLQQAEAAKVQAEREGKLNWMDDASQGAMAGSAAGPWGALIGGILGTAKGQHEAFMERKHEGQSSGSAFFNTIFDDPFGVKTALGAGDKSHLKIDQNTINFGAGMAGRVAANRQAEAAKQNAAPALTDILELHRQQGSGDWGYNGQGMPTYGTAQNVHAPEPPVDPNAEYPSLSKKLYYNQY